LGISQLSPIGESATPTMLAERERFELAVWFSDLFIFIVARRAQLCARLCKCNVISRGDSVAILQMQKAAPEGGLSN
jgi:hypothetical protein